MASALRLTLGTACLLLVVLALCEARPILKSLQEQSKTVTIVLHYMMVPEANFSNAVDITQQPAMHSVTPIETLQNELTAHLCTPRALVATDCHKSDIIIQQDEVFEVGRPTFQVQITNTCTNPLCSISFVIVHCCLFCFGDILVNPKVFRHLDPLHGTCIVNDGQKIPNAGTIIF